MALSYKWCCTVTSTNGGQIKELLLSLEAAVCKSLKTRQCEGYNNLLNLSGVGENMENKKL